MQIYADYSTLLQLHYIMSEHAGSRLQCKCRSLRTTNPLFYSIHSFLLNWSLSLSLGLSLWSSFRPFNFFSTLFSSPTFVLSLHADLAPFVPLARLECPRERSTNMVPKLIQLVSGQPVQWAVSMETKINVEDKRGMSHGKVHGGKIQFLVKFSKLPWRDAEYSEPKVPAGLGAERVIF